MLAIAHYGHRMPLGFKVELQTFSQMCFVFDDQNMTHVVSKCSAGILPAVPRHHAFGGAGGDAPTTAAGTAALQVHPW